MLYLRLAPDNHASWIKTLSPILFQCIFAIGMTWFYILDWHQVLLKFFMMTHFRWQCIFYDKRDLFLYIGLATDDWTPQQSKAHTRNFIYSLNYESPFEHFFIIFVAISKNSFTLMATMLKFDMLSSCQFLIE